MTDKKYISDIENIELREYNDKKRVVVEVLKETKIYITYNENESTNNVCVNKNGNNTIVLNGQIPIRIGCDHELSHIKYDSLLPAVWVKLDAMIEHYSNELSIDKQVTTNILRSAFNVMEDIRIESWDSSIYLGRKKGYYSLCKQMGIEMNETITDPINSLLAYRFMRHDVLKPEVMEEMKTLWTKSNMTTTSGIFKLIDDWIKYGSLGKYMKDEKANFDSLNDNLKRISTEVEEKGKEVYDKQSQIKKLKRDIDDVEDDDSISNEQKEIDINIIRNKISELEKEVDSIVDERMEMNGDKRDLYDKIDKITSGKLVNTMNNKKSISARKKGDWVTKQMNSIDKTILDKENQIAIKRVEELANREACIVKTNVNKNIVLNPYRQEPTIINNIQGKIKNILTSVCDKEMNVLSEDGDTLDVEAYIDGIKKGDSEFFNNIEPTIGTSILLMIDASGSMRERMNKQSISRIEACRNLVATIFKSVSNVKSVEIKAMTFAGSSYNDSVGFKQITNEKECDYIGLDGTMPLTPTHIALDESYKVITNMKGKNKILLFITDGYPTTKDSNGNDVDSDVLVTMANKSFNKIKRDSNIKSYGMGIFMVGSENKMQGIFGNKYVGLDDYKDIESFIMKTLKSVLVNKQS